MIASRLTKPASARNAFALYWAHIVNAFLGLTLFIPHPRQSDLSDNQRIPRLYYRTVDVCRQPRTQVFASIVLSDPPPNRKSRCPPSFNYHSSDSSIFYLYIDHHPTNTSHRLRLLFGPFFWTVEQCYRYHNEFTIVNACELASFNAIPNCCK